MTDPGPPRRRGRHASPDDDAAGVPTSWNLSALPDPGSERGSDIAPARRARGRSGEPRHRDDDAAWTPTRYSRRAEAFAGLPAGGAHPGPGLLDGDHEDTGPVQMQSRHRGSGSGPSERRGSGGDVPPTWDGQANDADRGWHPSAPLPPPPPGAWSRLRRSGDLPDEAPTEAQPLLPGALPALDPARDEVADEATDAHHLDPGSWDDDTGGLEVLGAHVENEAPRGGRRRRRRAVDEGMADDRDGHEDPHDDFAAAPRGRRRRRPLVLLVAFVVLAALVGGIVVGGQKVIGLFTADDYTGQGTGSVDVRVKDGDTLSDIARTMVAADVIASVAPFVGAADAEPAARGITAGVYRMRQQMSGQAALERLLDPAARLVSRLTIPEGLTVAKTLQRLADATGAPLADVQAAADPAALGLPAYAGGQLEGFLFPATYDIEPGDTPADVLRRMVTRTVQALDDLQVPADQRMMVLTKASLVQAEASTPEDMAKVARVLDNRLDIGIPLQLDSTVNYANNKGGITTTAEDRAHPSPYNTYQHPGLTPGPIGNPGEDAIRAVLSPAQGDWLYFVVVDPHAHDTRFATTPADHQRNVALFQQWLRDHPNG